LNRKAVIEMVWKMFGVRERFGAPKQGLLKVVRLIRGSGSAGVQYKQGLTLEPYYVQAYARSQQRMREIETEKAMATLVSRHQSWKSGGPQ